MTTPNVIPLSLISELPDVGTIPEKKEELALPLRLEKRQGQSPILDALRCLVSKQLDGCYWEQV